MKKNWKWFLISVVVLILSTLAIVGILLGWWWRDLKEPNSVIILLLIFLITSALAVGELKERLQKKPNYNWDELEEKSYFTIIWLSEQFKAALPDFTDDSCEILIMIPGIGNALVSFPTHSGTWSYDKPKVGERWKRVGDNFVRE